MKKITMIIAAIAMACTIEAATPEKKITKTMRNICHSYDSNSYVSVLAHYAWIGAMTAQLTAEGQYYSFHSGPGFGCFWVVEFAPVE